MFTFHLEQNVKPRYPAVRFQIPQMKLKIVRGNWVRHFFRSGLSHSKQPPRQRVITHLNDTIRSSLTFRSQTVARG